MEDLADLVLRVDALEQADVADVADERIAALGADARIEFAHVHGHDLVAVAGEHVDEAVTHLAAGARDQDDLLATMTGRCVGVCGHGAQSVRATTAPRAPAGQARTPSRSISRLVARMPSCSDIPFPSYSMPTYPLYPAASRMPKTRS